MLQDWFYLGIFLVLALGIPALAIGLAGLLAPRKPNPMKESPYECGIETVGSSKIQFKAQYYIIGLVFLIFDVEAILLFPFAVAYNRVGIYAVIEATLFVLILAGGLFYAWRAGAFEWA